MNMFQKKVASGYATMQGFCQHFGHLGSQALAVRFFLVLAAKAAAAAAEACQGQGGKLATKHWGYCGHLETNCHCSLLLSTSAARFPESCMAVATCSNIAAHVKNARNRCAVQIIIFYLADLLKLSSMAKSGSANNALQAEVSWSCCC